MDKGVSGRRDGERRAALLGYGLAGRAFHGPLLRATPGLRVAAIVTANGERAAAAARDFPDAVVLGDAEAVWNDAPSYDLVVVATPTASHAALAAAAVSAGLPVVVDKPLAVDAAEARLLLAHAAAHQVLVIPFHNRRWDSDHRTVAALIRAGTLGRVLRYESRFERWRPQADAGAWRERPQPGGGVLLDLGIHVVDQALSLFGPALRVRGEVRARRGGADDDVFIALEHADGVVSHLWASAVCAAPGPRLRVLGSAAALLVEGLDGQEAALRDGLPPNDPSFGIEDAAGWGRVQRGADSTPVVAERGSWLSFYEEVERTLRLGAEPPVAAEDALHVLEVTDAVRADAADSHSGADL